MFELHGEQRVRQDIEDRIRRARHRHLVARVRGRRGRRTGLR